MALKWSLVLGLVLSGAAIGQTTIPATAPATAPVATLPAADQTTPKGTLRMLFAATDAGDGPTIRSLLYTSSPLEEKMADTMANMSSAMAALQKAMKESFGEAQTKAQLGDIAAAAKMRDDLLAKQPEQIDGDTAVIHLEGMGNFRPVDLKKVDGKWKILIGKSFEKADPAAVEKQLAATSIQIKVIRDVAVDVAAGKHKNVSDVKQTLDARVRQAIMQYVQDQSKAATQPSTAPATQPK